jgi:hypothetical protein
MKSSAALTESGCCEPSSRRWRCGLPQTITTSPLPLRKIAFTDEQREAVRQLEAVRQTPPAHANALKYQLAKEAFDLMGFSAKPPTGMPGGPFRTIADRLYEAVTGAPPYSDATMRRACGLVLADQRKNNFHAFEREPLT